jgi:hypothetical protein
MTEKLVRDKGFSINGRAGGTIIVDRPAYLEGQRTASSRGC